MSALWKPTPVRTGQAPGQFTTPGPSLGHNRGCAALLSLAMSFIWTFCQWVASQGLLSGGAVSLSQGLLTQLPLSPCSCEKGNDAQGAEVEQTVHQNTCESHCLEKPLGSCLTHQVERSWLQLSLITYSITFNST